MSSSNPSDVDRLDLSALSALGSGLNRPECVLATASGALFACDWTLGIARISAGGEVAAAVDSALIGAGFLPNGIALRQDGSFLFANLGEAGGIWEVAAEGPPRPFLTEIDGRKIPPANFVLIDGNDRIWITVSAATRGHAHFTRHEKEGFVAVVEKGRARIVADRLTWTNELRVSPDGRHLYVNETFACRTTRFAIEPDGGLTDRMAIDLPGGSFPDGMAFDEEGFLWLVCVVSNRLIRIDPRGGLKILLEDFDADHFVKVTEAHREDRLTRDLIVDGAGAKLANQSSIAFGGPELRTLHMGSLNKDSIMCIRMPVAGEAPVHWNWA